MRKLKVHFAPSFAGMVHDEYPWYGNTIPFCKHGISTWCESVPIEEAEVIHVGQVREQTPRPYSLPATGLPMIVDVEGDHAYDNFREDLVGCVKVCCGGPLQWAGKLSFARPTMSRFLVHAARNLFGNFPPAIYNCLGFIGREDSRGVRKKMAAAMAGLPAAVCLQQEWHGPTDLGHPARASFEHSMLACGVALCPMGEGVATARFYEACYYGRFPIVIGETLLLGHGYADLGFTHQIDARASAGDMRNEMVRLCEMPLSEVQERGRAARNYFDTTVRQYFADPTLAFLNWFRGSAA
jgi:hypothetical protein